MAEETLLSNHMRTTEKRFDKLDRDIRFIGSRLDDLSTFKAEMIFTARTASLVVGGICGFVSLVASSVVAFLITTKIK